MSAFRSSKSSKNAERAAPVVAEDEGAQIETESLTPEEGVDQESDAGKLKQLLGVLKKVIGVKDLANMRLSLPANLLEPVGNLEYWHYLDRPDLFAAIGQKELDAYDRMVALLRWSFTKELHYVRGRLCKPYNSALGEQFRCVWEVSPASTTDFTVYQDLYNGPPEKDVDPTLSTQSSPGPSVSRAGLPASMSNLSLNETSPNPQTSSKAPSTASINESDSSASSVMGGKGKECRVAFVNEQVCHHPPISAFWYESTPGEGRAAVTATGVDQIAAKFNGTSVRIAAGSQNKGIFVQIPGATEDEYNITHQSAYITGFLSRAPYIIMSDHSYVTTLAKDGSVKKSYRTIIQYNEESWISKPKYALEAVIYETDGGVSASYEKIKQVPEAMVVARIKGTWRGKITIKRTKGDKGEATLVDLSQLDVVQKSVRPTETQDEMETRRFWESVSKAINKKDYRQATANKQTIEQKQRDKTAERTKNGEEFIPVFFDADISTGRGKLTDRGREVVKEEIEMVGHVRQ